MSLGDLAATVSAMQAQLVGVETRMRESEAQNASLRETIVNLTHENQLLKRRIYGNKTERTQTSELQLSLGDLFEAGEVPRPHAPVGPGEAVQHAGLVSEGERC